MGFLSKRLSELQTKYRKRYKRIGFGLKTGVDLERYLIYFLKELGYLVCGRTRKL
jgi:HJR/Mrr/RecB family endonuclease